MNAGLLVFILLLLLSFLGIPIFISLGIGTLIALNMADLPMLVLPQKLFAGMNSSSLLAIPFFILAGNLMSRSITGKLIDVANALIGRIKGSLALCALLRTIDTFRLFEKVNVLTGGGPAGTTTTITQFLYTYGIKSLDFGFGSAGAIVMTLLVLILSSFYIKRAMG